MSKFCLSHPVRSAILAVCLVLVLPSSPARAQTGSTLTPDLLTYVVNKDVGAERWTINLNLASLDPQRAINVTGNVYRSGQSPSFVWCQERDDSSGKLENPSSVFRLRCSGASACGTTATGCARSQWTTIADLVEIPASFFLPPGGNGITSRAAVAEGTDEGSPERARGPVANPAQSLAVPAPAAPSGTDDRGANLPPDGANFLVNKELGGQRWSISLNQVPSQRGNVVTDRCDGDLLECIVTNRFLNVTGNVYPLDDGPPQFVWCQERQDSAGDLADPQSEFRFGCVGASACTSSASECARTSWKPIPGGGDVRLQASFFLPPGGLPATPTSDPEIIVIGRTSDPPSMLVRLDQGASALDASTVQGSCAVGGACTLSAGSCAAVNGRIVDDPAIGCSCLVESVPPGCITCGGGATGQCGGDCQYQIGGGTARGQCLPFSSTSGECACYAADQGDRVAISICGGSLGTECPTGKCCADDVRDGCDPASGDADCPGICVESNGCDPTVSSCGLCFDQRDDEQLFCGTLEAPPGASCCEDCPNGSQNCFCDPGRSCNLEADGGGCCPTSRPDLCNGTFCIPAGADCCFDCPEGVQDCYCTAGSLCILESEGGGCCPTETPIKCGALCLSTDLVCCPDGESICGPDALCTADSQCVPAGEDDCGDGFVCEAGYQCVDEEPGCCRTDLTCGESCLTDGEDCCGDGFFCEAGSVCVGGVGAGGACCPADLPVLCGDSCFPAGTVCDSAPPAGGPAATSAPASAVERAPAGASSLQSALGTGAPSPREGMLARVPGIAASVPPAGAALRP